ncbi:iron chelate uptake ABC transporter family permease subunit [Actinomycetospora sp. CA-084318]|uniref:iron chelate uptake ABC transporter family permease subunit n=1 Tax=Actinomycetospora sp. CA-084318 TaxID=3239892 RepID=UPI003D997E8F
MVGRTRTVGAGRRVELIDPAVVGAALLGLSDLAARRLAAPAETPVGVVTAVCGAPLLLALLIRARRRGEIT